MLPLAVDEDFDNRIVRGLLRLLPTLDIVRVQDVGLLGIKPDTIAFARSWRRSMISAGAREAVRYKRPSDEPLGHAGVRMTGVGIQRHINRDLNSLAAVWAHPRISSLRVIVNRRLRSTLGRWMPPGEVIQ